jgi:hypothetical protein
MSRLIEIAARSQAYIDSLESNIEDAIYPIEQSLTDLNRAQLMNNKGSDDKPLINERTGNETLSKGYARRTGKEKPNLYERGDFQSEMTTKIIMKSKKYVISSYHMLEKYLSVQYKNYNGIAPSNQRDAYSITNKAIGEDYKKQVGLT